MPSSTLSAAAALAALLVPAARADQPCDRAGACEPIVLVPGIMGSRLRQHSRSVGSIETVSRHLWLPESHRLLQRSALLSSVSGQLYRSWVNTLNPLYRNAGMRVEPDRANWGIKGVACILKTGRECVPAAKVYWDMVLQLERAGYRAGTNLYGVPFDWRLLPSENKICSDLARVLHHITNTTGHRKAIVAAHSLGNLQLLYCFQKVFGHETLSKVKALVSIASPWAGAPQVVRVLFSGAEMVSRLIISDAETRDFSRQLAGAYMLLPAEQLFADDTLITIGLKASAAGSVNQSLLESYRGRTTELAALFGKVEALAPASASGMVRTFRRVLRVVDVWRAPPVPVVCVIGVGQPTSVSYGYCNGWPSNMNEEPCIIRAEDGDQTVPARSPESVCSHWKQQRRCFSPLSTVHSSAYAGETGECVDIVRLHCRSPNMESADAPRGGDHCTDYHSKILHKQPTIDLVQGLAFNSHAWEPMYSPLVKQADEVAQSVAWLFNSAARRLPPVTALQASLAKWAQRPEAASKPPPHAPSLTALVQRWVWLKDAAPYRGALGAVRHTRATLLTEVESGAAKVQAAAQAMRLEMMRLSSASRTAMQMIESVESICSIGRPAGADAAPEDRFGDALCNLGDATILGSPESFEGWERAQHQYLRQADASGVAVGRAAVLRQRQAWACSLREALSNHTTPLRELSSQVEWCDLLVVRLAEQFSRPPPLASEAGSNIDGSPPRAFESSVYGRIAADGALD